MDATQEILSFIESHELFRELSQQDRAILLPFMQKNTYKKGEYIFLEGDQGETLYYLLSGSVEILKKGEHRLAKLTPGDWLGEMALFGDATRSASAHALEKTEVIALSLHDPRLLSHPKILAYLAAYISNRLREANIKIVKSLKEELKLTKAHDQIGRFIIYLFILLTLYFYTFKFWDQYGSNSSTVKIISAVLITVFGLCAVILAVQSGYPPSFYGLTFKRWKRSLAEGILMTVPILLLMLVVKWLLITEVPLFKGQPLFMLLPEGHPLSDRLELHTLTAYHFLFITLYVLLVPVQEFLARGCLQSSLHNFFRMSNPTFWAILSSNLLFGMFHGLKSFSFGLVAFVLGLFWGWLYARQRSLVGPIVSHAIIGVWGFAFLNFQNILAY